ncbi:hypothetical protein [Burkholderia thailandensis]|uniref:hypothetical protein n=1 Tax=Burkholderia thailandensis TaxID=57975 RepID=UPI00178C4A5F|nr:hypothetical protein [Burkholderia thailandensis]
MSRNLTFDRSWDLTVSLDGEPSAESARSDDRLASFVESLEPHAPGFRPIEVHDPRFATHAVAATAACSATRACYRRAVRTSQRPMIGSVAR